MRRLGVARGSAIANRCASRSSTSGNNTELRRRPPAQAAIAAVDARGLHHMALDRAHDLFDAGRAESMDWCSRGHDSPSTTLALITRESRALPASFDVRSTASIQLPWPCCSPSRVHTVIGRSAGSAAARSRACDPSPECRGLSRRRSGSSRRATRRSPHARGPASSRRSSGEYR